MNDCYKKYYCEVPIVVENIANLDYEYVYIYHHHSQHGLKDIMSELKTAKQQVANKGGKFYLFTCLRKTVPFVNSHVNYINNNSKFKFDWNFNTAITEPWFHNYQSKYLLSNHVSNWKANNKWPLVEDININQKNIGEILKVIDKIYITENIDSLKTDLQRLVPNVDSEWRDKKINTSAHRLKMTREQEAKLIERNQLDIWLYNSIKND